MGKRIVLFAVLTMGIGFASIPSVAGNVINDILGAFLAGDTSYVPLKSTASVLDAQLRWDAVKGQAVLTYDGQDLALTPNNVNALLKGQPVVLSSPPVVVNGVTYIPASALKKFYNVPVVWDGTKSEMKIQGPNGWKTIKVKSRPPWHGGPPPWAPAWGRRGQNTPDNGKAQHPGKAATVPTSPSTRHKEQGKKQGKQQ